MPVYRYKCTCGLEFDQFLRADKDSIILKCKRCGKGVSARQVRDRTAEFKSKNEVTGLFQHD